jgi:RNA polymerase sigma factor (sigma-70 family)
VATLFGRYVNLLYGLSLKHLKQSDECIDTVYEIFELITEKLKNHDIDNFKSWLYRVACNYCIDKIRKAKNKTIDISAGHLQLMDDSFELMDNMKEKELILEKINNCMLALNDNQRVSIEMFFFQEKSYQTIAGELNISWDQTRSLIQNGKRNLKNCMQQQ